jgi:hypothetical protein
MENQGEQNSLMTPEEIIMPPNLSDPTDKSSVGPYWL